MLGGTGDNPWVKILESLAYALGVAPLALGYATTFVILWQSPAWRDRLARLAPAGRMALTNYLLQSLVCMVWFYGFAFGHYGMPRARQLVFVAVVYVLQVGFSHWWLARFRYGPMEWFWRGFTYRQVPPWRVAPLPPRPA